MSVHYVRKAFDDPALQVADRIMPRLRQAFLDAIDVAIRTLPLAVIEAAVKSGNPSSVLSAIVHSLEDAMQGKGVAATSVRDALQAAYAAAAKSAVNALPASVGVDLSFNLINPQVAHFLESYEFEMIQSVAADARQVIQQVLIRGANTGTGPAVMAREIRDTVGLTARQEVAVANYRRALEGGNAADLRDALTRSLRDGRFDPTVSRAIQNEVALRPEQVNRMVARYRERYRKYRAEMIARTEAIRAANAGQQEVWSQARQQGLLRNASRKWIGADDERECDECDELNGEVVGMEEEFSAGVMHPPLHPHCRCSVGLVFGVKAVAA